MSRPRLRRALVLLALGVTGLPLAGCDTLTVHPFAGTVMQFTVSGAGVTPPGQHLELWARDAANDVVRIDPYYDTANGLTAYGLMVRQAIGLDDPCLIDDQGNLVTTAAAYPSTVVVAGVTQTPDEQAKQVRDRISQLAPPGAAPLLAVLPYDPTPVPAIDPKASAAERLKACTEYRMASDRTYVANPLQITAPAHGYVYGFIAFVTITPPTNYDGFRLDTPISLQGVQELFFTSEGPVVDPRCRGPLFMVSQPTPGGRDVVHFDLIHADPAGVASGAASLYVDLGAAPAPF